MPTTKILPGQGNTQGIMTPMIPFNVVVETDVGLLSLIYKEYMDEEVFDPKYFEGKTVKQMVYDLYTRKDPNPLSLCIRDEYRDMAATFYEQFMEREYDKILDMSVITEFYRVIGAYNQDSDISVTLVCDTDSERDVLLSLKNTSKCNIMMTDAKDFKTVFNCNQFYFKNIIDCIPYAKHFKRKTIYFANYAYNRGEDDHIRDDNEIISVISLHNDVRLIDIFSFEKLLGENNHNGKYKLY